MTRSGWRLVNHFALGQGDIDHLLVGPGGAYVIETKWSATSWRAPWMLDRQRAAAHQAAVSARRVSLWPPFRSGGIRARPIVVLWTSDTPEQDRGLGQARGLGGSERIIDGTVLIDGAALRGWLGRQGEGDCRAAAESVWPAILEQVRVRDAYESSTSPLPLSAFDMALRAIFSVTSALAAALLVVYAVQWTGSLWSGAALASLTIVGGMLLARSRPSIRWFAWSFSAGAGLTSLAVLALVINMYLRDLVGGG